MSKKYQNFEFKTNKEFLPQVVDFLSVATANLFFMMSAKFGVFLFEISLDLLCFSQRYFEISQNDLKSLDFLRKKDFLRNKDFFELSFIV